jgi:protein-S-isoprenylcysteine O-methyltransferase
MILLQGRLLASMYLALFGAWLLGEVVVLVKRRATTGLVAGDRGFVGRALLVMLLTNLMAIVALKFFQQATFATIASSHIGLLLMGGGLALRWWAVAHLGRFFTVDVAVFRDHSVVDSGPYRWIRHPAYAGMLSIVVGIALCFGNFLSMLIIVVPIAALMQTRIRTEEEALIAALGDTYRSYMNRTKRLIPAIY